MTEIVVDGAEVLRSLTITVKVRWPPFLAQRFWVGYWLLHAAGWAIGSPIDVDFGRRKAKPAG